MLNFLKVLGEIYIVSPPVLFFEPLLYYVFSYSLNPESFRRILLGRSSDLFPGKAAFPPVG